MANIIDLTLVSPYYDLVLDTSLNPFEMDLYNNELTTKCLMVDADVSGKTFNYIRNVEDESEVISLTPTVDVPPSDYFQYQYATTGYTMFEDRMESGWSIEFITDFNTSISTYNDVLYYMGKTENISGHTAQVVDNNFLITLKNNRLHFKQQKYKLSCDCEDATDIVENTVIKSQYTLPTGTTHHLVIVFKRDISLNENELHKGNMNCKDFPNMQWYDGKKWRKGKIKIYLDGYLKEVLEMEEPIFRATEDDLSRVQGWGLADESIYDVSMDLGLVGSYTGNIKRGRFYSCPLTISDIRTNFDIFSGLYNISSPSDC